MKPIALPAWKLTADCIWNSFRSSGKRHLLLTGSKGSGKTTLLGKLSAPLPGITTRAVPGEAVYLLENGTGREARIGIFDALRPGPDCRMSPFFYGFAALGIPALQRCMEAESEWISIDEIGYLELSCPEYCRELLALMGRKRVLATVRKQQLPFLLGLLNREDAFVIDLDRPFGTMGCVIMASGLGKRFGGNKLMADFLGQPMISRALDATDGIFAKRIVVTRHSDVAQLCRERGIEVIHHDRALRSDTVRLGLEAMGDVTHCLFCPSDQPLLRWETAASLALCGGNCPEEIWRTAWEDTPGAPILFPSWSFPELLTLPDGKGGGYVVKQYPARVRTLPVPAPAELRDADTREDLAELCDLARSRGII